MPTLPMSDRVPSRSNADRTPLADLIDNGKREQVVRRRIVYDYRPMYVLAFVICFCFAAYLLAMVVQEFSTTATARACVAAGHDWRISNSGQRECVQVKR